MATHGRVAQYILYNTSHFCQDLQIFGNFSPVYTTNYFIMRPISIDQLQYCIISSMMWFLSNSLLMHIPHNTTDTQKTTLNFCHIYQLPCKKPIEFSNFFLFTFDKVHKYWATLNRTTNYFIMRPISQTNCIVIPE